MEGLNEVVSGGTAASAFAGFPLDRLPVAGKTGTGQKRGYDDFALFACFAPADKPRIVVVVVIEQGGPGSQAAAPVARKILEAFFHVQPTVTRLAPSTLAPPEIPATSVEQPEATAVAAPLPAAPSQDEATESPPEQGGSSSG